MILMGMNTKSPVVVRLGCGALACVLVIMPVLAGFAAGSGSNNINGQEAVITHKPMHRVTPSAKGTDLYDFVFDNATVEEVVKEVVRATGITIIARKTDLQDVVTVNLRSCDWLHAMLSILDMHHLTFKEKEPGPHVYEIQRDPRYVAGSYDEGYYYYFPGMWFVSPTYSILAQSGTEDWEDLCNLLVDQPLLSFALGAFMVLLLGGLFCLLVSFCVRRAKKTKEELRFLDYTKILFGRLLSFGLCIIYGFTFGTYTAWTYLCSNSDCDLFALGYSSSTQVLLITPIIQGSVFSLFFLVLYGLITELTARKLGTVRLRWRIVAWSVFLLPLLSLLIDTLPVRNDYSWEEFPHSYKDAKESYECLLQLTDPEALKLKENVPYLYYVDSLTNALAHADEIEKAWSGIAEGRKLIERMNSFGRISDLTTYKSMDWDEPWPSYMALRKIGQTYWAFAHLRVAQGRPQEGIDQLIRLHTVARKAMPLSRLLINRMMWISVARTNIETAHRIAQSPNCTPDMLRQLKSGFPPLDKDDMSLRWPLTAEYLLMKTRCRTDMTNATFIDEIRSWVCFDPDDWPPKPSGFWMRNASRMISFAGFRRNKTIRDMKQVADLLIDGAKQHPPDLKSYDDFVEEYCRKPQLRNLGGWFFVCTTTCGFSHACDTVSKVKVTSDLFAIYLHRRLGEKLKLLDYHTRNKYFIDRETGWLAGTGPDKKKGTDDDIILGKWRY